MIHRYPPRKSSKHMFQGKVGQRLHLSVQKAALFMNNNKKKAIGFLLSICPKQAVCSVLFLCNILFNPPNDPVGYGYYFHHITEEKLKCTKRLSNLPLDT